MIVAFSNSPAEMRTRPKLCDFMHNAMDWMNKYQKKISEQILDNDEAQYFPVDVISLLFG